MASGTTAAASSRWARWPMPGLSRIGRSAESTNSPCAVTQSADSGATRMASALAQEREAPRVVPELDPEEPQPLQERILRQPRRVDRRRSGRASRASRSERTRPISGSHHEGDS